MSELQITASALDVPFKVNPEVPVELFDTHVQAKFWIGRVATMGTASAGMEDYYDGLTEFRANVYVHELGFLSELDENGNSTLDEFGRETDNDDARSVNFAVVEQVDSQDDIEDRTARVVGSGRLIVKFDAKEELPIEHYFPELFTDKALPEHVAEVSRFIARHEDSLTQHKIALGVIRSMVHYCVENDIHETFCIIEKPLVGLLQFIGLPLTVLSEPKDVPEYGGVLFPVRIEPFKVIDSVEKDISGTIHLKEFFQNTDGHIGDQAYYNDTLMDEA